MKRIIIMLAAAFGSTMAHGQDDETSPTATETNNGVTVPLMLPPSDSFRQSFVRLINSSRNTAAAVRITATDDGGNVYDPVTVQLPEDHRLHFNSGDLADGNTAKGIEGIGAPIDGNWRLSIETDLTGFGRLRVQSFVRHGDGFLTSMHEVLENDANLRIRMFNPASNTTQQSRLRLINYGETDETLEVAGYDDNGTFYRGPVFTLPAGHSRTLTAVDLEQGAEGLEGVLGDGAGKWELYVSNYGEGALEVGSIIGQHLLYSSSGHISNLSTGGYFAANNADIDTDDGDDDDAGQTYYGQMASIWIVHRARDEGLPLRAGISWGYLSEAEADEAALSACGHTACRIDWGFPFTSDSASGSHCIAVGYGHSSFYGLDQFYTDHGATIAAAQDRVLQRCGDDPDMENCRLWHNIAACADGSHTIGPPTPSSMTIGD